MSGVSVIEPDGAFYAFFNISHYFGKELGNRPVTDSAGFCTAALDTSHVALVPGSAFGAEGYVRMSFACDTAELKAGLERLAQLLKAS